MSRPREVTSKEPSGIEDVIASALDTIFKDSANESVDPEVVTAQVLQALSFRLLARGVSEERVLLAMQRFVRDSRSGIQQVFAQSVQQPDRPKDLDKIEVIPNLESRYSKALLSLLMWGVDISGAPTIKGLTGRLPRTKPDQIATIPDPMLLVSPPSYFELVQSFAQGPVSEERFRALVDRQKAQRIANISATDLELFTSRLASLRKEWQSLTISEARNIHGSNSPTRVLPANKDGVNWSVKIVNGTPEFQARRDAFESGQGYRPAGAQLASIIKDAPANATFMSEPRDYMAFVMQVLAQGPMPDQHTGTLLTTTFPGIIAKTGKRGIYFYPVEATARSKNIGGLREITSLV